MKVSVVLTPMSDVISSSSTCCSSSALSSFFPLKSCLSREMNPPRSPMTVSQQAMRQLMAYGWPGNVRQLENALERAVALGAGRTQIELSDLPPDVREQGDAPAPGSLVLPEGGVDFAEFVESVERDLIRQSLERTGGNKGRAARLLNLKRTTLVEKLKRMNAATHDS